MYYFFIFILSFILTLSIVNMMGLFDLLIQKHPYFLTILSKTRSLFSFDIVKNLLDGNEAFKHPETAYFFDNIVKNLI